MGKALEKHRKNGGPLKCKKSVSEAEAKERLAATMKAGDATHSNTSNNGKRCNESLIAESPSMQFPTRITISHHGSIPECRTSENSSIPNNCFYREETQHSSTTRYSTVSST